MAVAEDRVEGRNAVTELLASGRGVTRLYMLEGAKGDDALARIRMVAHERGIPAESIRGPGRRRHFVRYRMLRMPGAVVALAEELGGGYRLELRCDHFEDPTSLVERIRTETRAAIAHPYLALDARLGRTIAGDVVAGAER